VRKTIETTNCAESGMRTQDLDYEKGVVGGGSGSSEGGGALFSTGGVRWLNKGRVCGGGQTGRRFGAGAVSAQKTSIGKRNFSSEESG